MTKDRARPETSEDHEHILVFFDGVCNLCSGAVQFILRRDVRRKFKFASLQSDVASQMLRQHRINADRLLSIIVITRGRVFERSDAVLKIASNLRGLWPAASLLRIIPRPIRDSMYDFVAQRRYKWFGKRNECMIPTPDIRSRFLDNDAGPS